MLYKDKIEQLSNLISSIEEQLLTIEFRFKFPLDSENKVKVNIFTAIYNSLVDLKNCYRSMETGNNIGIRERVNEIKARNLEYDHSPDLIITEFFNETTPSFLKITRNLNCICIQSFYEKYFDIFRNNIFFQTCFIEQIEEYESGEEYENLLKLIADSDKPKKDNIVYFKQAEH